MRPTSPKSPMPDDDDDLFDKIVQNKEIGQITYAAIRNSMMARGAEDGFVGNVWPLFKVSSIQTNAQECSSQRYGMQAILEKESPHFFGGWSKRYTVLKGNRLIYKQNQSPISPTAGILNFNLLSCEVAVELKKNKIENFRILIVQGDKQFVFRGLNQKTTDQWYAAIAKAVYSSQGWGKQLTQLAKYPRFWRKDYQSESQFRKTVQSGDILLFRGMKDSSVMQRAVTRDQFDHAAVVILNQIGQPLIFQANGGFGVGICPWVKFMQRGWWKQYQIIVHRKLKVSRTDKFLQVIQKFVGCNMGKSYDFSLTDFLFQRSSSADKQHQHYFCSSLVAKLYKKLRLLPSKKSCKQYLPSSFADKQNLQLQTNQFGYAFLDKQKIIAFNGKINNIQ